MAKKLLCVIVLILALIYTLASCDNKNANESPNTSKNQSHTHSYGEWIPTKAATCTTDGIKERYCSCGDKITETIQSTGHSYGEWIVIQAATCTESGTKAKQCSCGDKITETIQSTGHNWVDATCTEDEHCTNCNKSSSGTATGHIIQHGACVFCHMPGASMEWGHGNSRKWVEYYFEYSNGDYTENGGGYLSPDYGSDGAVFYRDGYLYFTLSGERNGQLIFNYQIEDSYGRVVKNGTMSVGYVSKGEEYLFDYCIGSLQPGEYTLTVSSKNAMG